VRLQVLGFVVATGITTAAGPATHGLLAERNKTTCSASPLCELEGFVILTCTNVAGGFEGANFDKVVKLDNGMIFEFREYHYHYAYHPEAVVLARPVIYQGKSVTLHKLLIDDEVYDVFRIR
jgi:hypothetical protein